jgi:hypothetical protein
MGLNRVGGRQFLAQGPASRIQTPASLFTNTPRNNIKIVVCEIAWIATQKGRQRVPRSAPFPMLNAEYKCTGPCTVQFVPTATQPLPCNSVTPAAAAAAQVLRQSWLSAGEGSGTLVKWGQKQVTVSTRPHCDTQRHHLPCTISPTAQARLRATG